MDNPTITVRTHQKISDDLHRQIDELEKQCESLFNLCVELHDALGVELQDDFLPQSKDTYNKALKYLGDYET